MIWVDRIPQSPLGCSLSFRRVLRVNWIFHLQVIKRSVPFTLLSVSLWQRLARSSFNVFSPLEHRAGIHFAASLAHRCGHVADFRLVKYEWPGHSTGSILMIFLCCRPDVQQKANLGSHIFKMVNSEVKRSLGGRKTDADQKQLFWTQLEWKRNFSCDVKGIIYIWNCLS